MSSSRRTARHAATRTGRTARVGLAALLGLAAPLAALPAASPVGAADIRTETKLGGFRVQSIATPLQILIDDPSIPIPRPPDAALLEADPAYSATTLSTGPTGRALASTLWPGSLIGDGLATAANNEDANYPFKADATYPGTPEEQVRQDQFGSGIMKARAEGLDVVASATSGEPPSEVAAVLSLGQASSSTTSTVEKDVAIGRAVSQVTDVSLAGQIKVKSVRSTLETRSDGKKATSTGSSVVSGLSVAGFEFAVDDKGLRLTGTPAPIPPQTLPPTAAVTDMLRDTLGITIEPPTQGATADGTRASRTAKGLRITIDTAMYRAAVNDNTPLDETAGTVLESIPILDPQMEDAKKQLYYLFFGTPKVTYILGAGSSASVANLPLVFDFDTPPLPFDSGTPFDPGTAGTPGTPGSPGTPIAPGTAPGAPIDAGAPVPQVPAPTTALPPTLAASGEPVAGFAGIGVGLLLLTAGLAAGAAWGLNLLSGLALAGAALGRACRFGAPSSVPDLRTS